MISGGTTRGKTKVQAFALTKKLSRSISILCDTARSPRLARVSNLRDLLKEEYYTGLERGILEAFGKLFTKDLRV